MFEKYGLYVIIAGAVLIVLAWLAMVRRAFGEGWGWGLSVLLLLGLPLFILLRFARAKGPILVFLVGGLLIGGTFGANHYVQRYINLGPRDKMVEGQRHLTLTGWNGGGTLPLFQNEVELETGYAILKGMPDIVVLQMANPDVTDQTLDYLAGMELLQELDLNDTQVTDEGLKKLAALPKLRILRIRKTPVTDQGFRDLLFAKETLLEVDARETAIASKTLREWKEARKDERKYLR
jgi:hypothetical protein